MRTPEILDAIKRAQGVESDYAVAALLDVTRSAVSKYRLGRSHFDDETAIRAAELAGLDAGYVIACAHAERAKSDPKKKARFPGPSLLAALEAAVLASRRQASSHGIPLSWLKSER